MTSNYDYDVIGNMTFCNVNVNATKVICMFIPRVLYNIVWEMAIWYNTFVFIICNMVHSMYVMYVSVIIYIHCIYNFIRLSLLWKSFTFDFSIALVSIPIILFRYVSKRDLDNSTDLHLNPKFTSANRIILFSQPLFPNEL